MVLGKDTVLKAREKSFLGESIDQGGSSKAAIGVLENKGQVVEGPKSARKTLELQGGLDKSLQPIQPFWR